MTQKEKAELCDKAYDKVAARFGLNVANEIFPELKESEDERIRKALIQLVNQCDEELLHPDNARQMLAWLEKQGEKLPVGFYYVNSEGKKFYSDTFKYGDVTLHVEKQGEKDKPTYNTYSKDVQLTQEEYDKKRVSDEATIKEVEAYKKGLEDAQKIFEKQGEQKPVENKGMDLVEEEMTPFQKKVFCIVDTSIEEEQGLSNICNELLALAIQEIEQKPAWSEEDEKVRKVLKEAGYEWSEETHELKKIPNALEECEIEHIEHGKYYYCIKDYYSGGCKRASKGVVVQALRGKSMMALGAEANKYFIPVKYIVNAKPVWSEEDEYLLDETVQHLEELIRIDKAKHCACDVQYYQRDIDWLKSLKDRIGG